MKKNILATLILVLLNMQEIDNQDFQVGYRLVEINKVKLTQRMLLLAV
jgi:hypothetical protein